MYKCLNVYIVTMQELQDGLAMNSKKGIIYCFPLKTEFLKKKEEKGRIKKNPWHLPSCMLEITYELALCKAQTQPMFLKVGVFCVALCLSLGCSAPVSYCTYLEFFCILHHFKDRNINSSAFPEMTVCLCVCVYASLKLPRLKCCFLLPDSPVGLPEQQALFQ